MTASAQSLQITLLALAHSAHGSKENSETAISSVALRFSEAFCGPRTLSSSQTSGSTEEKKRAMAVVQPLLDSCLRSHPHLAAGSLSVLKEFLSKLAEEKEKDDNWAIDYLAAEVLQQLLMTLNDRGVENRQPGSEEAFKAVKECVRVLGSKLQVQSVDSIIYISRRTLSTASCTARKCALDTLAVLFASAHPSLLDLVDMISAAARRLARFDPSPNVQASAANLSLEIEHGLSAMVSSSLEHDSHRGPPPKAEPEALAAKSTSSPLFAFAQAPLLKFSSSQMAASRDNLVQGILPPHEIPRSLSSHGMGSGIGDNVDLLADVKEVGDFLRGSIASLSGMASPIASFDDVPPAALAILRKVLEERCGTTMLQGGERKLDGLGGDDIESLLQRCLDRHSEEAYERHLDEAEMALELCDAAGEAEIQQRVEELENVVHGAVAREHAEFLETMLPKLVLIVSSPTMLNKFWELHKPIAS